jgi:hypothetical protein
MYNIQKIIKTTALLAGLFGFVGCGGTCCESDVSVNESGAPSVTPSSVPSETIPIVTPKGEPKVEKEKNSMPPVAVANDGVGIIEIPPCSIVHFTSEDNGNDDNITYSWTSMHSQLMSNKSSFDHKFGKKGLYETTLTVTDEQNLTAMDRVCILVGINESEIPLVADAGADEEIGSEQNVTLTGRAVCRYDVASFQWKEGNTIISNEAIFSSNLPLGKHTLKLIIEDFAGKKAYDSVVVTVK